MKNKRCRFCHRLKPLSSYHKCKPNKDGFHSDCKRCRSKEATKRNSNPKSVYRKLKERKGKTCSQKDFIAWYNFQPRYCTYCQIPEALIKSLPISSKSGFVKKIRLEIDRIDSFEGYILENITLACPVCNAVKNNILDFEDMKIVGQVIKNKWQKLFNKKGGTND